MVVETQWADGMGTCCKVDKIQSLMQIAQVFHDLHGTFFGVIS
jgi:hypothetical protein